jgi:hypothetical protein
MADEPAVKPPATVTALLEGQYGVLAAPLIYADYIGGFGHVGEVVNLTLCSHKHLADGENNVSARYVVAHLRMPLTTLRALREVCNNIELSLQPPASAEKN